MPFRTKLAGASAVLAFAMLASIASAGADEPCAVEKLIPNGVESDDRFGAAVAVSGDVAVIGMPDDEAPWLDSGSALIVWQYLGQWERSRKVDPSDPVPRSGFGAAAAIDNDVIVIGAFAADGVTNNTGAAYVYDYNYWPTEHKLTAADGRPNDDFGVSVAVSGDAILVGANGDDDDRGAVYVYRWDPNSEQWLEEAKLIASDGAVDDRFGSTVALHGNVAVIGASGDDDRGDAAGAAYVFRYDANLVQWVEEAKLLASDGDEGDVFGTAVAVEGVVAVVGAPRDEIQGEIQAGSAYVFRHDGQEWIEEAKVHADDFGDVDRFGGSASVKGDVALIGASWDDEFGRDSGSAYVFRYQQQTSQWIQEQEILPFEYAGQGDRFGAAVTLRDDLIMIGAPYAGQVLDDAGFVYTYEYDAQGARWDGVERLLGDSGAPGARLGRSIAMDGDAALVGAPGHSARGEYAGSATIFRFDYEAATWIGEIHFAGSDTTLEDRFGNAVAIKDEVALVGAARDDNTNGDDAGKAYVFRYEPNSRQWSEEARLLASDGTEADLFGTSVATDGEIVVVGAPQDADNGAFSGSAYVFRYDGQAQEWVEEAKLIPADNAAMDAFGISLATDGNVIAIGATGADGATVNSGAVYVFRYDPFLEQWNEEAKLTASDGIIGDDFGATVALDGDAILIGAVQDYVNGTVSGSAYYFEFDGQSWVEDSKIIPAFGGNGDHFGRALALHGDVAFIGREDLVFFYRFDPDLKAWVEQAELTPWDDPEGTFGAAVATNGDHVLIGAYGDDAAGSNSGSVYVFDIDCAAVRRPDSFQTIFGAYLSGTIEDLFESDDAYVVIQQRPAVSAGSPLIRLQIEGTAQVGTSSEIVVVFEAGTDAIPGRPPQKLRLFDFDAGAWEVIDERIATLVDSVVEITLDENPSRFIQSGDRAMRLRAEWFDPGNVIRPSWIVRIDQTLWEVTP